MLLNKSFDKITPPKSALASAGESNGTVKIGVAAAGAKADLELSSFHARDENIRDLIISELHLSEGDVGQPSWQEGKDSTFSLLNCVIVLDFRMVLLEQMLTNNQAMPQGSGFYVFSACYGKFINVTKKI